MAFPLSKKLIPVWTSTILIVSLVSYFYPPFSSLLIYDRVALMQGELWRLFSGHLVHFSSAHLFYNLISFGVVGWIIEYKQYPYFGILCLVTAFSISLVLLITHPNMVYYGGLSGLNCAVIAYLSLWGLREPLPWKGFAWFTLIFLVIKIGLEMSLNTSLLAYDGEAIFVPIPVSHAIGFLVAGLFYLVLYSTHVR